MRAGRGGSGDETSVARCDQESVGSFLERIGLGGFNPDLQHRWVGEVVDCDVGEDEVGSGVVAEIRAISSTDI